MTLTPTLVFEDAWMKDVLFPGPHSATLTFDEWLGVCGESESPDYAEGLLEFAEVLRQAPQDSDWFSTLQSMRQAPLRTVDDVDFCFSHLAQTPKNQFLAQLLRLYLDSPLSYHDTVARADRVMESRLWPVDHSWVFVRGAEPSALFGELARSSEARLVEAWELDTHRPRGPGIYSAPSHEAITRAADKAVHWLGRGLTVRIHLEASKASRLLFQTRLARHGWSARGLNDPIPPTPGLTPLKILPFHPLGLASAATATLVYWEQAQDPPAGFALDQAERRLLLHAGFCIVESLPRIERDSTRLAAWLQKQPGPCCVFFGSPPPLPGIKVRSLKTTPHTPATQQACTSPKVLLNVFSAASLQTYAECPARFAYRYLAGLRPDPSPEESFGLVFGQLVHKALEQVFLKGSERNAAALSSIFEGLVDEGGFSTWFALSLKVRFKTIAAEIPRLESTLLELAPTAAPRRFEQDFEIELPGPHGSYRLKGRMDRVDFLESGAVLVLDYKTGTTDFSPEHIRKGTHFQAWAYLLAARKVFGAPAGVLFYDLKALELRRGCLPSTHFPQAKPRMTRGHCMDDDKLEEILTQGHANARHTLDLIGQQHWAATPQADTCQRCEFGVACRKRKGWRLQ